MFAKFELLWASALLLCALSSLAIGETESAIMLVEKGQGRGRIVTPAEPSKAERFAAEELQTYIKEISGAQLPIQATDEPDDGPSIVVGRHRLTERIVDEMHKQCPCKYDAIAVVAKDNRLHLVGHSQTGTIWAAWDWLESLGVRWLMPSRKGEYVPSIKSILVRPTAKYDAPVFDFRGPNYSMSVKHGAPEAAVAPEHGISASALFRQLPKNSLPVQPRCGCIRTEYLGSDSSRCKRSSNLRNAFLARRTPVS